VPRSRWTLATILHQSEWLRLHTCAGLWQLMRRLAIHYKRARSYIHSPDEHYQAKLALIAEARQEVAADPERCVLLYQDELTYYRQPSESWAYEQAGHHQPLARRTQQRNTFHRVAAALNAHTGQVVYYQADRMGVVQLRHFYRAVVAAYPRTECIYLVQDNWPVHFHPNLLSGLMPQGCPWPPKLSHSWSVTTVQMWQQPPLPIQILCLPTYASWCNPIEKLWRWLKQEVLHLHTMAEDWPGLRRQVATFLDRFADESPDLLRYVGLLPD
jgi:hypothetical protein